MIQSSSDKLVRSLDLPKVFGLLEIQAYSFMIRNHPFVTSGLIYVERVEKSGDNYSLSAIFLANSSHIMAGVSTVWLEF